MTSSDIGTPAYEDGWFNGNPRLMIQAGSYERYRDRLKGFTPEQMAEFDALEAAAKPAREEAVKARAERQKKNDVAAAKKDKERKAERKKVLAKRAGKSTK